MTAEVDVVNETDLPIDAEAVRRTVDSVLQAEGVTAGVAVAFVPEDAIAELNTRYRAVSGPTDVLSFPYRVEGHDDWPEPEGAEDGSLGDLVICPAVAAGHAREDGAPLSEELGRLLVHGVLHLLGQDHETDDGEMLSRQDRLVTDLAPLFPALLPQD